MKKQKTLFPILTMLILALCLSAFVFCISPTTVHAAETHTHNETEFEPWTKTDSLPTSGNYYLTADVTVSATTTMNYGTVHLCLNGHNIYVTDDNVAIYTTNQLWTGSLNIYDCSNVTHKFDTSSSAWVLDEENGTETLYGGLIYGGFVHNDGDINIYGGILYTGGNSAIKPGISTLARAVSLYGGAIVGCTAENAVYVFCSSTGSTSATFTMSVFDDFRICGNSYNGVNLDGILNIYGGKIDHNGGAGIQIIGNGSGVGEVNLYGGTIEDNAGGGIYANGELNIKGNPVVKNNTLNGVKDNIHIGLYYSAVYLSDELTAGADIGVTIDSSSSDPFFTTNEAAFITSSYVGENGYIKSDNANYVTEILAGRIALRDKTHTHSTTDGVCSGCGRHIHNGMEYIAWEKTDSLPTYAGNYYLTNAVSMSQSWTTPTGEINIDLNGKPVSINDSATGAVINVSATSALSLYTCSTLSDTIIWGAQDSEKGGGVYVEGVLKNYNVKMTGNGNGAETDNIKKGAGVYIANGGKFYAYGGKVSGNKATVAGSGVYVENGGNLYIQNNPQLGEVYLETGAVITVDGTLAEGASITVDLQDDSGDVTAVSAYITNEALSYFSAKESKCELFISNNKIIMKDTTNIQADAFVSQVSISLDGDIGVNFYWMLNDTVINDATAYFLVTLPNGETEQIPVTSDLIATPTGDTSGRTYYKVTGRVAAKEMAEDIVVEIYAGGELVASANCSVRGYAERAFAYSDDAALVAMMKAMLNYGAASQALFGHNTGDLANSILSDDDKIVSPVDENALDSVVISGSVTGIKNEDFSCILETKTTIRHYFSITEGTVDDYYFSVEGREVTPVQITRNGKTMYYVDITDIAAKDMDNVYTFMIVDKNDNVSCISTSVYSYMNAVIKNKDNTELVSTELVDTVNAMYAYGFAAYSYFG